VFRSRRALLVLGAQALVIFRTLRVAAVALLPDAVPLALTFGSLGLGGIPLDAAMVVVGCLALGIAVDDTIHLLAGFTEHPLHRGDARAALEDTLRCVLPPTRLAPTAICVGFGVLGLSGFALTRDFGLLTAASVGVALLTNSTRRPAFLLGSPVSPHV
jgi:uncharacterized protein